mgnify:CR=1 FL=1
MAGSSPEDYAESMRKMKASKENFSIIKQGIAFHSQMIRQVPGMTYGDHVDDPIMGQGPKIRTDVTMTIFLNPPEA